MDSPETPEVTPVIQQPGLSRLREAVANYTVRRLPQPIALLRDSLAGFNCAVASVPDGLACGILAGVNPIFGLYAAMMGPLTGGILSSSPLLVITTTSASALAAGEVLAGLTGEARYNALFLMVILVGAIQLVLGLLRMGRLTRFVSYSVMTGFMAGIAVLMILSQLPTIAGYEAQGENNIARTINLLANLDQINPLALGLATITFPLMIRLPRTRLGGLGVLAAIAIPSLLASVLQWESVRIVGDIGDIPHGIPGLYWPSLSGITPNAISGALSVAVIILVQGAGVSQSIPNPGGAQRRISRDFIGQGAANIASGIFRGLPVGGSLSSTALNVASGALTRWSAISAGLWMVFIVTTFPDLVSLVIMPALGVVLIIASLRTLHPRELRSIWDTGWTPRLTIVVTFLATLFLPIALAVGLGVVLSAVLDIRGSSADVTLVELVRHPDGQIEECGRPQQLRSNAVTVLDVYGHLFYAGARTLERLLPSPSGAERPVVVLRLRGHTSVGATLVEVLEKYAQRLQEVNGRLYLTGLSNRVHDQMVHTGKLGLTGPVRLFAATPILGQSTRQAFAHAETWLVGQGEEPAPGDDSRDAGAT